MLINVLKDLFGRRRAPVEREVLRIALDLNNESRHEEAIKILTTLIENKPNCVEALILRGAARRAAGQAKEGLPDLMRAAALAPDNAPCLYEIALAYHVLGDNRPALKYCELARQVSPAFTEPRWLQAQIVLGGENYFEVLKRVHAQLKPRTYVEVGVFQGDSLRLATPPTQAIGIDPDPKLVFPLAANHRVFTETSDAFFSARDLRVVMGDLPVDLAFIDGMHHFEFALRDFANLERYCTRESTILIHDCYPLDRETARRDGSPPFWSGDIWRLTVLLKKYRPDLAVHTIGAPPTGLGLVRNLDPQSLLLVENHDQLCQEFLALDYEYLDHGKAEKLNLVANDWEQIRVLLGAS